MKFANTKSESTRRHFSLAKDVEWILRNALRTPDTLFVMHDSPVSKIGQRGLHIHEDWELFHVIRGPLQFELAGKPASRFAGGSVLIVPPGCLHSASGLQSEDLRVLVMNIPQKSGNCETMGAIGNNISFYCAFSAHQFAKWTDLLGESPGSVIERIVQLMIKDGWGRYHAAALLRALLATYAEVSSSSDKNPHESCERRASEALLFLQSKYYDANLSLPQVADAVNLSVSRLSSLFQQITGHSVQQTLIDIRLRRAMTHIKQSQYSIKEIAHLTGWSNQLYFSAAFRRRYNYPPSYFRNAGNEKE